MDELQAQIDEMKKQIKDLQDIISLSFKQKIRLDNALKNTKTYYVATGPTGPTQTPLTFKDGILTAET